MARHSYRDPGIATDAVRRRQSQPLGGKGRRTYCILRFNLPIHRPSPERLHLQPAQVMQRHDRLTPRLSPESDRSRRFSIEHRPITLQPDTFRFEYPRKRFVATAERGGVQAVLALKRRHLINGFVESFHRASRQDISAPTVGELESW